MTDFENWFHEQNRVIGPDFQQVLAAARHCVQDGDFYDRFEDFRDEIHDLGLPVMPSVLLTIKSFARCASFTPPVQRAFGR